MSSAATTSSHSREQLSLAVEAYIWGFPRMLYAKYLGDFRKSAGPFNQFLVMDRMATPDEGGVNVDTLYGVAWLDLRDGPVVLEVPDAADRYYSIVFIDQYANNFAYVGRRTTGTKAGRFLIAGADWQGDIPAGMTVIRAPGRYIWAFLRTLIQDERDLPACNAFNGAIALAPLANYPGGLKQTKLFSDLTPHFPVAHSYLDRLGAAYFDLLGDALAEDPPSRAYDLETMRRFAELGVGPGKHPLAANPQNAELFAEAVKLGHAKIFAATVCTASNGWSANWGVDEINDDPLFTATINRFGIGMLGAKEAVYLFPADLGLPPKAPVPMWGSRGPDGAALTGKKSYRLYFPAGRLPPADAFWSITMYKADLFLYRNPIDRYAIGDRTSGLQYGKDGSLELLLQHHQPASGSSNWLPAPDGEFVIFFRVYQPRPEFINGEYQLPPLEII